MAEIKVRCMRCKGRKKMYKMGSGYSLVNTGGVIVDCPMCLGQGTILPVNSTEVKEMISNAQNHIVEANKITPAKPLSKPKTVLKQAGKGNAKKESRANTKA